MAPVSDPSEIPVHSWMWSHLKDIFISSYFSVSSFSWGFSQCSHLSASSKGTRTSWIRPEQQQQQRFLPVGHFLPSGEPALQTDSPKNLFRHKVSTFPLEKNGIHEQQKAAVQKTNSRSGGGGQRRSGRCRSAARTKRREEAEINKSILSEKGP